MQIYIQRSVEHTLEFYESRFEGMSMIPRIHKMIHTFRLYHCEFWDGLIFYLIREAYGFGYPMVFGAVFNDGVLKYPVLMVSHFEKEQSITYDMWKQNGGRNYKTRFHLAALVYFCRLVGVPISMDMIKIKDGVPYLWEISIIGVPNSRTLKPHVLRELFGISINQWTLLMEGNPPSSLRCSRDDIVHYYGSTVEDMPHDSMLMRVVEYLRQVDIDLYTLRSFIHLRANPVKSSRETKQVFKTKIKPRLILSLWEKNNAILCGNSPYDIFNDSNY